MKFTDGDMEYILIASVGATLAVTSLHKNTTSPTKEY